MWGVMIKTIVLVLFLAILVRAGLLIAKAIVYLILTTRYNRLGGVRFNEWMKKHRTFMCVAKALGL